MTCPADSKLSIITIYSIYIINQDELRSLTRCRIELFYDRASSWLTPRDGTELLRSFRQPNQYRTVAATTIYFSKLIEYITLPDFNDEDTLMTIQESTTSATKTKTKTVTTIDSTELGSMLLPSVMEHHQSMKMLHRFRSHCTRS